MQQTTPTDKVKQVVFAIGALDSSSEKDEVAHLLNSLSSQEMRLLLMLYGNDPDGWTKRYYKRLVATCFVPVGLASSGVVLVSCVPAWYKAIQALPPIGFVEASALFILPFVMLLPWGTFRFFYVHNNVFPKKWQERVNCALGEDTRLWPVNADNGRRTLALIQHSRYTDALLEIYSSLFRLDPSTSLERLLRQLHADNVPPLDAANRRTLRSIYELSGGRGASRSSVALRDAVVHEAAVLQDAELNRAIRQ